MAFNWEGAAGGAGAGAMFGPWGALVGGIGGGLLGGTDNKMKSAEELGINKFDAQAEAKKLMPTQAELNTQRNAFTAYNNQSTDGYAKQLIASGMNPQQAYTIAQNKLGSNVNKFEVSQQQSLADQQRQITMGLMPRQFEREDDLIKYDMMRNNQPNAMMTGPGVGGLAGMYMKDNENAGDWGSWIDKLKAPFSMNIGGNFG